MTNQTVEKIKELDIYEIIKSYMTNEIKKTGTTFKACCPFHEEKTPSFTITPERGMFKCFGCGEGGDAISFVMKHEHYSFYEAITDIAKRFNLPAPKKMNDQEKKQAEEQQKKKEAMLIVNEFAKDHFFQNLKNNKPEYITKRISGETAKRFEIGFAKDSWDDLRNTGKQKAYKENLLIDAGLLINRNGKVYDRFRNRMIFPIHNQIGRIIGFSGRDISGNADAKYINSPDSDVFKKGNELRFFYQTKNYSK